MSHRSIFNIIRSVEDGDWEGRKVKGVGVMKDEEGKLEEIEVSLTLGGVR